MTAEPGIPEGLAPANPGVIANLDEKPGPVNPLRDPRDRRIPRVAGPCVLVMFGVTGDLARKKLMPAVYDLANRGLLPPGFSFVGFARRDWEDEDFAQITYQAVKEYARTPFRDAVWEQLSEGVRFVSGSFGDDAAFDELAETVRKLDAERGTGGNYAFYLSIPPGQFPVVVQQLKRSGLSDSNGQGWRRVVIEKPFGHDLASARELNDILEAVFPADSVFRIDHYLGKETVQNILALRFANEMYEPIWNRGYVDHVQISMAEDIGIGGRAGYYDGIGAARDVIQNHLLQLLALTAMEEPVAFDAQSLRMEKEKVLSAVRLPADLAAGTARGQYSAGWQGGRQVRGFLEEEGIPADSRTETYAALRLGVDTRRWAGVPFYLRAGKRLPRRMTEIALIFQRAPHLHRGTRPERAGDQDPAGRGDHGQVRLEGTGHGHGGPGREHGLRLRRVLHRIQSRGLRAAAARRPHRRPAAVPPAGRGRARLADPRPGGRLLGLVHQAGAVSGGYGRPAISRRADGTGRARLAAPMRQTL
jgi:glucose-6-phosphate 1-dehydrogenase